MEIERFVSDTYWEACEEFEGFLENKSVDILSHSHTICYKDQLHYITVVYKVKT